MPDTEPHAPDGMPAAAAVPPPEPIRLPDAMTVPAPAPEPEAAATEITCPVCGHVAPWGHGVKPTDAILRCDACGQRIAYGTAIPVCIASVHKADPRFITLAFHQMVAGKEAHFTVVIDKEFGRMFAEAIQRAAGKPG